MQWTQEEHYVLSHHSHNTKILDIEIQHWYHRKE